mmetsp:Transcript_58309/g.181128  ORF Transcript_58309/g.181128 Transcript_58309/m.181128 type:complete len:208 (-) Transcript_58309:261-884(-)
MHGGPFREEHPRVRGKLGVQGAESLPVLGCAMVAMARTENDNLPFGLLIELEGLKGSCSTCTEELVAYLHVVLERRASPGHLAMAQGLGAGGVEALLGDVARPLAPCEVLVDDVLPEVAHHRLRELPQERVPQEGHACASQPQEYLLGREALLGAARRAHEAARVLPGLGGQGVPEVGAGVPGLLPRARRAEPVHHVGGGVHLAGCL